MDCQNTYVHNSDAVRLAFSKTEIALQFGQVLKRVRIEANLYKPEALSRALCDYCGVHHSSRSIYRYESGQHSPSLEFLVATSLIVPNLFSDLLTEVLSPGIVEKIAPIAMPAYFDSRNQLELFKDADRYSKIRPMGQ